MKLMKPFLASLGMTAAMCAVSAWALTRLPDTPIPAHWAIDGQPDRFARPASVLFILPATALALSLLFVVLPGLMPPRGDLSRSRVPYEVSWLGAVLLMLLIHLGWVALAMGAAIDLLRLVAVGVGALLIVLGNFMPKARYNFVIGLRTPWTLADERVWDRSQRFAGACMMLAGVLGLAGALLAPGPVALLAALVAPIAAAAIVSVTYSAVISPRVG